MVTYDVRFFRHFMVTTIAMTMATTATATPVDAAMMIMVLGFVDGPPDPATVATVSGFDGVVVDGVLVDGVLGDAVGYSENKPR